MLPTTTGGRRSTGLLSTRTRPTCSRRSSRQGPIRTQPRWAFPTPLGIAAANDRSAGVVAALVDAGADANAADEDGWTALHWAAKHAASPHVFAALVAAGADPDAADDSGWTPLHVATRDNSPSVVRALIESGVDARRRTSHGWSALTTATMLAGNPMVAGEILRRHLPATSLTEDRRWMRRGLHEATCWFEHDRAWPPKECYYFVVNEDHDDSASSLIAFPVVRLRSSGARPRPRPIPFCTWVLAVPVGPWTSKRILSRSGPHTAAWPWVQVATSTSSTRAASACPTRDCTAGKLLVRCGRGCPRSSMATQRACC